MATSDKDLRTLTTEAEVAERAHGSALTISITVEKQLKRARQAMKKAKKANRKAAKAVRKTKEAAKEARKALEKAQARAKKRTTDAARTRKAARKAARKETIQTPSPRGRARKTGPRGRAHDRRRQAPGQSALSRPAEAGAETFDLSERDLN